ncbi:UvrD-helicase domain-containing protein [Nocardioides sp.]|uniref:UvrD-helicase domain-containing protein n=1 Tax=Nocardioides sp. TaxID=35761 RepID=UPI003D13C6C8
MEPFDLTGDLPSGPGTTVLEASAGTGKTFTLAGLVTRYVAEGRASLDEMLLITFGRAASQELRERVRAQLVDAARALDDGLAGDNALLAGLLTGSADELAERRSRLRDALAGFDAATIATTHQFCQLVLKSLGVAGDTDAGVTLVESLDDLVTEVVDDLYLQQFGQQRETPVLTRAAALSLALEVVRNPHTELRPLNPAPGSTEAIRIGFARAVCAELEHRKRRLGVLGYDDLLSRLAAALEDPEAPARDRMRGRWRIVMVDEFQDTDPVQWQVIDRAFGGHSTVVLIGDPKQAIYAFRGGDIVTYLDAARTAGLQRTLGTNWRSDAPLVTSLQTVLQGAALGHPDIVVREVEAHRREHRLAGAPHNAPFRLRVVTREKFGMRGTRTVPMDQVRDHVAADLASDIAGLLASGASYDGRPIAAADIAVIVEAHRDARVCRDALAAAGVPAVYTGDTDVFASEAARDWLCLLEAFGQPHRSGLVRAAAVTMFFGESAESLANGGDELTDRIAGTLREWADHARERGIAAVFEAAQVAGMGRRVLSWRGGERHMTDLAHVAQVLHETAHRDRLGLPALLDWLREQCSGKATGQRNRRLDSDAAAVQVMTVWVSKGLQYPVVYLPFAFNRNVQSRDLVLFHEPAAGGGGGTDRAQRCLHVGGKGSPGFSGVEALGRAEMAGDDIRLTYVALTRAQSQVVTWWAPSWDEPNGGLSRLLRGRDHGDAVVPDRCEPKVGDVEALACFRRWESLGGPVVEESALVAPARSRPKPLPAGLGVRRFTRSIDVQWRRTSYSGLIRSAEEAGVSSEPEAVPLDDESLDPSLGEPTSASGLEVASPMADLPAGAAFGSLVHAVLETADPLAPDLLDELRAQVREHLPWWPVETGVEELAEALVPLHRTPLGPLAPGLTLGDLGLSDRLCELDFEIPLSGGDHGDGHDVRLAEVGVLLQRHLNADDPLLPYAARLLAPGLGEQSLRGYLSGSIDVVLRVPGPAGEVRYLVVDYKTNRLGDPDQPLTAADYSRDRLEAAMTHSDYPLQALLYLVVVHRYLRWRQPGYEPGRHLGGALYLYLRGMCGADTPTMDGHPAGVFSWTPPPGLVTDLSDLLDGRGGR